MADDHPAAPPERRARDATTALRSEVVQLRRQVDALQAALHRADAERRAALDARDAATRAAVTTWPRR